MSSHYKSKRKFHKTDKFKGSLRSKKSGSGVKRKFYVGGYQV